MHRGFGDKNARVDCVADAMMSKSTATMKRDGLDDAMVVLSEIMESWGAGELVCVLNSYLDTETPRNEVKKELLVVFSCRRKSLIQAFKPQQTQTTTPHYHATKTTSLLASKLLSHRTTTGISITDTR